MIYCQSSSCSKVEFKNCVPFTKCITKIDGTTIDDAEDLDLFMATHSHMYIVQINLKQQEFYGFIQKMKQLILMLILQTLMILNL